MIVPVFIIVRVLANLRRNPSSSYSGSNSRLARSYRLWRRRLLLFEIFWHRVGIWKCGACKQCQVSLTHLARLGCVVGVEPDRRSASCAKTDVQVGAYKTSVFPPPLFCDAHFTY